MRSAMFLIRCEFSGLPRSTAARPLCIVVRKLLLETLAACLLYCMYIGHRVYVCFFLHHVFGRGLTDGA